MARHAKDIVDYLIWVEDTPPPIVSQIQSDVIFLGLTHIEWKITTLSPSKKIKIRKERESKSCQNIESAILGYKKVCFSNIRKYVSQKIESKVTQTSHAIT